jgi:hypothetical protein
MTFLRTFSAEVAARRAKFAACLLISTSLTLSGCVTTNSLMGNKDDPNDVCRAQRAALRQEGNYFSVDILTNAAITGVVSGLAVGLVTGNAKSGLIAAGVGTAVGAAGGYLAAVRKKQADEALVRKSVLTDVDNDNKSLDKAQVALDQLMLCRKKEAESVREAFRRGDIKREEADFRMREVKQRWDRDIELAQSVSTNVGKRAGLYAEAAQELDKNVLEKEREMMQRAWLAVMVAPTPVSASAGGVAITQLTAGSTTRVVAEQAPHAQVIMSDGQLGWVALNSLLRETDVKARTVTSDSPIFSSPSANASVVERVPRGQTKVVTGRTGQFAIVDLGRGQRGFMRLAAFATAASGDAKASEGALPISGAQLMNASLTNQSKRDNFTSSVQNAQASENSLFELVG